MFSSESWLREWELNDSGIDIGVRREDCVRLFAFSSLPFHEERQGSVRDDDFSSSEQVNGMAFWWEKREQRTTCFDLNRRKTIVKLTLNYPEPVFFSQECEHVVWRDRETLTGRERNFLEMRDRKESRAGKRTVDRQQEREMSFFPSFSHNMYTRSNVFLNNEWKKCEIDGLCVRRILWIFESDKKHTHLTSGGRWLPVLRWKDD